MDQLKAMRTFVCVAEHGGFAVAARSLKLAPSVVTRLVADLEGQLGARLLTRTTRRVALTQIGKRYYQRVRDIVLEVDAAAAAVTDEQRHVRGKVRIISPPLFAARQLMSRLHRLHAQYPDIAVEVSAGGPVETLHEAYDISIVVRPGELDGDFIAYPLARSQVMLCASPEYLRRCGHPQHPADLAHHALLIASLGRMPRAFAMTRPAAGGAPGESVEVVAERVLLSSQNGELSRAGALGGMGIAALPSFAVQEDLAGGRLQRVLVDWRLFDVGVHACLPSRKQVPAVVRAVLDFLRAEFPDTDVDPWSSTDRSAPLRQPLRPASERQAARV
jgi:DNA-binding transcriptional LysR family regulator